MTNPFVRLQRLLPDSPALLAKVLSHNSDGTSTLRLPIAGDQVGYSAGLSAGARIRARGTTVAVGSWAIVRAGVVESEGPNGDEVIAATIGSVVVSDACARGVAAYFGCEGGFDNSGACGGELLVTDSTTFNATYAQAGPGSIIRDSALWVRPLRSTVDEDAAARSRRYCVFSDPLPITTNFSVEAYCRPFNFGETFDGFFRVHVAVVDRATAEDAANNLEKREPYGVGWSGYVDGLCWAGIRITRSATSFKAQGQIYGPGSTDLINSYPESEISTSAWTHVLLSVDAEGYAQFFINGTPALSAPYLIHIPDEPWRFIIKCTNVGDSDDFPAGTTPPVTQLDGIAILPGYAPTKAFTPPTKPRI
jgi:hypothetical protein